MRVKGHGRATGHADVGRAGGVLGGGRLPLSLRSAGRHRPTALARSDAYLTVREANNHSKEGVCPRARAPLSLRLACLIAPVLPSAHPMLTE